DPARAADLAAAVACRSNPGDYVSHDGVALNWLMLARAEVPMGSDVQLGRDEMTHHYYAQSLFNEHLNGSKNRTGGAEGARTDTWTEYRTPLFDHLKSTQAKDGSWTPETGSEKNPQFDPIRSTAVWCILLRLESQRHPLTFERAVVVY